ncbi:MAG: hypothetical protein D6725_10140 [Planctomycetota bacterium]|nr:MAG: hypothetical protein D6725_10140 [Planctomycetota bacterium]
MPTLRDGRLDLQVATAVSRTHPLHVPRIPGRRSRIEHPRPTLLSAFFRAPGSIEPAARDVTEAAVCVTSPISHRPERTKPRR